MTKALLKAIMTRSGLKNVYLKIQNTAYWNNYKYQRRYFLDPGNVLEIKSCPGNVLEHFL